MNIKTGEIPSASISLMVNIGARQRAFQRLLIEILYKDELSKVNGIVDLLDSYEQEEKTILWAALNSYYGPDPLDLPDGIKQS